jgi:hypothetical protein
MHWIKLAGGHHRIGYQLGELARNAYSDVLPGIQRYLDVTQTYARSERLKTLENAGRVHFPELMAEIDGIAEGAGIPFETVLAWNCRGDFPGGGDQTALAGCTDVMATQTRTSPALMAHNEDDQPELDGACFIVAVEPDDALPFISFYSPGLLPGHTFGWNSAGLVQNINHLRTHDQGPGVPRHLVCRAILSCSTLDEALSLLDATPRAGAFHHNLGQVGATPRLVSVEATATGIVQRPVTSFSVHANHLVDPALAEVAQTVTESSARRHEQAGKRMSKEPPTNRDAMRSVLADGEVADWPIRRRSTGGLDSGFTLASAVFELTTSQVLWQIHGDPAAAPVFEGTDMTRSL